MSRILRSLVCLLLICCILVNLSPLKAKATGAGVVAGGIVKAASVSIPALWPIVATLAVVGITAYGIESGAFENIANSCYSAFESAGTWINNGMAEILRTEDSNGNVQYYVDGGMLEDVRSWIFDSAIVSSGVTVPAEIESALSKAQKNPYYFIGTQTDGQPVIGWNSYGFHATLMTSGGYNGSYRVVSNYSGETYYYYKPSMADIGYSQSNTAYVYCTDFRIYETGVNDKFSTSENVTLGYLPDRDTVLDDETIVTFHPYLADVVRTRTGGSGGSGEDENKWWLAVAYAETLEKLYQTSQQAQIENPSVTEIPDIQVGIEYDVTEETDEDDKMYYVLDPIQTPGTGTDPGTGDGTDTDPDTGTGSGNGSGNTGTDSGSTGNTGSSWKPPSDHSQFALADLSKFFPFCIPFDLFDFFKLLNADPVAPSFTWEIQDLSGQTYGLTVDLSQWDSVAQLFRRLQLFLFVCGLAAASRKYIKW